MCRKVFIRSWNLKTEERIRKEIKFKCRYKLLNWSWVSFCRILEVVFCDRGSRYVLETSRVADQLDTCICT